MEDLPITTVMGFAGFAVGFLFGGIALRTNFCTMGAISDMVLMGDWNRFRAWMLAIAVAILGSQALHQMGLIDLNKSIYLTLNVGWAGAIIGGLMFGFGMTMAGGCGNKTLVRIGAGNLKSLVVAIVLGIFAYMTLRGLTGLARVELEGLTNLDLSKSGLAGQGIPDLLAAATGLSIAATRWAVTLIFAGALLVFCFKSADFRRSPLNIAAGLLIGLLISVGWYATGVIGHDDFDPTPLASLTFVNPVGNSIQYLMTFTGSTINFGIATVGGVIAGSFVTALATKEFRVEAFTNADDMVRHMIGGALMGIGGIVAMGCTIGQGLTGMSTLAIASLIALLSIVAGGVYGIKYMEEGSLGGAFTALFARG
jgi:uncharacterized membrane protein YedE/YeeE